MERWQDQALILSTRPHGESGAVMTVFSEKYGKYAGYLPYAKSTRMRGVIEPGNLVHAEWSARTADNLGTFRLEEDRYIAAGVMNDRLRLSALKSVLSLCDQALPERESYPDLFHGTIALADSLESELWLVSYVMWEVSFLRVLGFALDFSRCAGGGAADDLYYMSPKSGCTVSRDKGEVYKDKLLPLPSFLRPERSHPDMSDLENGLALTRYFLENWVFAQHTRGIPEDRLRFQERFAKYVIQQNSSENQTALGDSKEDEDEMFDCDDADLTDFDREDFVDKNYG